MPQRTEAITIPPGAVPSRPHIPSKLNPLAMLQAKLSNKFSKSFPLFASLPTEIRLQIWEAALPDGRVHELHPCSKLDHGRLKFRSNSSTPPTILHVNHESRTVALRHLQLMDYNPVFPAKPVKKFYFDPIRDTLFLNTLMALYMTLILLDEVRNPNRQGVLKGWQNIAFDADRAHLVTLLSGRHGQAPRPQFQRIFPDLKELAIAFDFTPKGKTKFRTSVWPGENGTSLVMLKGDTETLYGLFDPIRDDLAKAYIGEAGDGQEGTVELKMAKVKRKLFIRGDLRYVFRKACAIIHLNPRGVFRLI